LYLGSLLSMLGFKHTSKAQLVDAGLRKIFWLSSREERRESDATLLYDIGKGVRFDIGFIGRGNPEIALDKVPRFEREIEVGRKKWYLATIIIVDRIGEKSRIEHLANKIGGKIIQMSMAYWPQAVAKHLSKAVGFKHDLARLEAGKIPKFLHNKLKQVNLESLLGL
jgi:hypothetical protein